jgi:hypothetical protein
MLEMYVVDTQAMWFQVTMLSAESSTYDPKSPHSKIISEQTECSFINHAKVGFHNVLCMKQLELRCENHKKDNTEEIRDEGKREVRAQRLEAAKTFVFLS